MVYHNRVNNYHYHYHVSPTVKVKISSIQMTILLLLLMSIGVSCWTFGTVIKSSLYNNHKRHVSNFLPNHVQLSHSSSTSSVLSSSFWSTKFEHEIDNNDTDSSIPLSSTSSKATKTTTILSLQHYMLERNVTIKSVTWCNTHPSCDSLLQIYRGKSVPSVVGTTNTFHHNRYNNDVDHKNNDNNKSIKHRLQHFITLLHEYQNVDIEQSQQGDTDDNYNTMIQKAMNVSSIPYTALSVTTIKRIEIYMKTMLNNNKNNFNINTYETFKLYMKLYSEMKSTQYSIQTIIQNYIHIIYIDQFICIINKPSGILSVPGPRRNPNTCTALYHLLHSYDNYTTIDDEATDVIKNIDQMVVHRLDMDTSGIIIYALNTEALHQLHTDFRQRNVIKQYQALLCGHVNIYNTNTHKSKSSRMTISDYEIDVDLERDPYHPPFMRIVQPKQNEQPKQQSYDQQLQVNGSSAFFNEAPKPCLTEMHILSYEYITDYNYDTNQTIRIPVTRVQLIPRTGRTHQLRVHMAQVIGHPIVGDDIYGYGGDCYITTIFNDNSLNNDINHNDISLNNNNNNSNNNMIDIQRQLANLNIALCLHAHKLHIRHPISNSPMIFECQPNF